jgi:hypothetical protein
VWQNVHHDLETVKAAGFCGLNLTAETFHEILIDDTIGSGEEGEDVRDEMAFIVVELVLPIV